NHFIICNADRKPFCITATSSNNIVAFLMESIFSNGNTVLEVMPYTLKKYETEIGNCLNHWKSTEDFQLMHRITFSKSLRRDIDGETLFYAEARANDDKVLAALTDIRANCNLIE